MESLNVESEQPKKPETPLSRRPLVILGIALLLTLFVAAQFIGVLYAIVFPPSGPDLPGDVLELSHTNEEYGVDYWVYGTNTEACQLVELFRRQGGDCRLPPFICTGEGNLGLAQSSEGQYIGGCTGEMRFSVFALRWEASISTYHTVDGLTHFSLLREVLWLGVLPSEVTPVAR